MTITDPQASTAAPKKDLTSEQSAGGGERGGKSPSKSGRMKLAGLGLRMLLKVAFLVGLFLFAKQHGMF
jgi:hypothetical protein